MKLFTVLFIAVATALFSSNTIAQQFLNLEFEQLELSNLVSKITDIEITPTDRVLGCDELRGLFLSESTMNNGAIKVRFLLNGNVQHCKYSVISGCAFTTLNTGEVLSVSDENLAYQIIDTQNGVSQTYLAIWESDAVVDSKDSVVFKSSIQKVEIDVSNGIVTKFKGSVDLFQSSLEIDLTTVRVYCGNQTLSLNTIDSTFQGDGTGKLNSVNNAILTFDAEFSQVPPENAIIFLEYGGRFNAGDEIKLKSNNIKKHSSDFYFTHALEANIELNDSIKVPDPFQTRLAIINDNKIIVAVNPLNALLNPISISLDSNQLQGLPSAAIFSSNGEALFIGTTEGQILRISGITKLYDTNDLVNVTYQSIYDNSTHSISGLAVDPNDGNRLLASMLNNSGTATVGLFLNVLSQVEFLDVSGDLPSLDVLDCELDLTNPSIAFIGTSSGIWASSNLDNSQVNWYRQASEMINDTVIEVTQQTQSSEISSRTLFALTRSTRIWKSESLVGVVEEEQQRIPLISVYPNPVTDILQISFEGATRLFRVFDLSGRLVSKGSVDQKKGIDFSQLDAGAYLLQFEGQQIQTFKVIKQ